MTVGSGYQDQVEPGNESTAASADNAVATGVPFITQDGVIGLIDEDYSYDGYSYRGTIAAIDTTDTTGVRLTVSGITDDGWTSCRHHGAWLYLIDGDGEGYWYQVDWADGANNYIYIAGFTEETFQGAVGDQFDIGRIHAVRDFGYLRSDGSARLDRIMLDHDGADGVDSSSAVSILKTQIFTQGLAPSTPLSKVGETQIDESERHGVKWRRLAYDSSPAADPRSSRIRLRLLAYVRGAAITVRKLAIGGKAWPR